MVPKYAEYLTKYPDRLDQVAYALAERREHLKYRAYFVTDGTDQLTEPTPVACSSARQAAFVFTGQGAQWYVSGFC